MRDRSLLPFVLSAAALVVVLAPQRVRAQDECATDADCEALYRAGFRCVTGSSASYCVEPRCGGASGGGGEPCETDEDCVLACGDTTFCDLGACQPRVLCVDDSECGSVDPWGGASGWCNHELHPDDGAGYCTWGARCDPWSVPSCTTDSDCEASCGGASFCDSGLCEPARRCDEDDDCERIDPWSFEDELGWCDTARATETSAGLCSYRERPNYFYGCSAGSAADALPPIAAIALVVLFALARRRER